MPVPPRGKQATVTRLPDQRDPHPSDPFAVSLEDDELRAEVDLIANLIVCCNASTSRLTQAQIDEALGLTRQSA